MPRVPRTTGLPSVEDALEDPDAPSAEEAAEELSKADHLRRYMAAMNFSPRTAVSPGTMEFYRIYSDPVGKTAKVVAVVQQDPAGFEPDKPDYFIITVQIHVKADQGEVERKAPAFVRQDLLRVLAAFADPKKRTEHTVACESCGAPTSEPTRKGNRMVCKDCLARPFTKTETEESTS